MRQYFREKGDEKNGLENYDNDMNGDWNLCLQRIQIRIILSTTLLFTFVQYVECAAVNYLQQ